MEGACSRKVPDILAIAHLFDGVCDRELGLPRQQCQQEGKLSAFRRRGLLVLVTVLAEWLHTNQKSAATQTSMHTGQTHESENSQSISPTGKGITVHIPNWKGAHSP